MSRADSLRRLRGVSLRFWRAWLLTFALLFAIGAPPVPAPPAEAVGLGFAIGIGGSQFESAGFTDVDTAGNVYVAGMFRGTVDFDRSAVRNDDVLTSVMSTNGLGAPYSGLLDP